ncbi:MAG: hypothetical protein ACI8RZ_000068 [Myxococcota bacterium]
MKAVSRTIKLPAMPTNADALGYFRFDRLSEGRIVLTNDAGEWQVLAEPDFRRFVAGEIKAGDPLFGALQERGFIREDLDAEAIATRVRRKKRFLGLGPHLHVVITTLRCNQSCKYCHASRTDMDRVDTDMSIETAKGVVDLAMQSPSPYINFEYTGGEPTVNMPALKFIVEYSREKNRYEGKSLDHSVVTNMTYMTEEIAEYLIENNIWVCTSLDGTQAIHDWNRSWGGTGSSAGAYNSVIKWIKYFNRRYVENGLDPELYHVDALMTSTRKSFEDWKAVVDLYIELGIRNIHIRALNPFGFATKTWKMIGYTADEFLEFYEKVLDYIIELNLSGVQIMEGTAATLLKKILTPDDPNFVDIRSPIGSGTGQIAYSYDGKIYPSDEGRMVAGMGDDFFAIGEVGKSSYAEIVNHPTVRALALSSITDGLPGCSTCWNAPFCGVRPLHNYMNFGDLFAQRPLTPKCREHMTLSRLLIRRLDEDSDGRIEAMFRRWVIDRPRPPSE